MKATFLLVSCLMVLASVKSQTPCYPCDPSWPRPLYYPNFLDCGSIWECMGGNLTLTQCNPGTVFDFLLQACVIDDPSMLFTCNKLINNVTCVAAASG